MDPVGLTQTTADDLLDLLYGDKPSKIPPGNEQRGDDVRFRPRNVFRNDSTETVPPYALMRVVGMDDGPRYRLLIDKPDGSSACIVNGPRPVEPGMQGAFQDDTRNLLIRTDVTEGSIGAGDDWPAVEGSGFKIHGVAMEGVVLAAPMAGEASTPNGQVLLVDVLRDPVNSDSSTVTSLSFGRRNQSSTRQLLPGFVVDDSGAHETLESLSGWWLAELHVTVLTRPIPPGIFPVDPGNTNFSFRTPGIDGTSVLSRAGTIGLEFTPGTSGPARVMVSDAFYVPSNTPFSLTFEAVSLQIDFIEGRLKLTPVDDEASFPNRHVAENFVDFDYDFDWQNLPENSTLDVLPTVTPANADHRYAVTVGTLPPNSTLDAITGRITSPDLTPQGSGTFTVSLTNSTTGASDTTDVSWSVIQPA